MPQEFRDDPNDAGGTDGNVGIDPNTIDAAGTAAPAAPGGRKKRRDAGQPRGPKGGKAQASRSSLDLSSLTGMFVGLHASAAIILKTPELEIAADEGKAFMDAAQNVMRHYGVEANQKTIDWIAFFGTAGGIYLPRFAAIHFRHKAKEQPRYRTPSPQAPRQNAEQAMAGAFDGVVIEPDNDESVN